MTPVTRRAAPMLGRSRPRLVVTQVTPLLPRARPRIFLYPFFLPYLYYLSLSL